MGTFYNPRLVTDGLVLCLDAANTRSYPGAGTTWTDLSKNKNNGTLTNGPTFSSANGGSIVFDGSDDYITATNLSKIDFTTQNEITICLWYKINYDTEIRGLLQFADSAYSTSPWILLRTYTGGDVGGRNISWYLNGSYRITYNISIGQIYYSCLTYSSNLWTSYLNGLNNGSWSGPIGGLGGYLWLATGYNGNCNMNIYNCNIYNRALSAAEIKQNYNATKGRFGL